ncbi:MYB DNA-binding domain protein, partial [Byssothecium circinans]
HHYHCLLNQHVDKRYQTMGDTPHTSPLQHYDLPSVVGQEGMPPPAQRPRGPKLEYTAEDDQLLMNLKEKKNLSWMHIADFFPGRSLGSLQLRYSTKLEAKTTVWTDDMVQKLGHAMHDYENDRWRIISSKVGSGFSPAACREKAAEI